MNYETHPISIAERQLLTSWFASKEAGLFKDLVESSMEHEWLQAIKVQAQASDSYQDQSKFSNQAAKHINAGDELRLFLQMFNKFSSPDYPFQRLKHK